MRVPLLLAGALSVAAAGSSTSFAAPVQVGDGSNSAYLVFNWSDGYVAEYDVRFNGTIDGYALTELADAADDRLTVDWTFYSFGNLLNYASYDDVHIGDAKVFDAALDNWWRHWETDAAGAWKGGPGASSQIVSDGSSTGWVFASNATPVPEPTTLGVLALAGVGLLRRRRAADRHE